MKKSSVIRGGISTLALAGLLVNSAIADTTATSTQNVNTVVPSILDKMSVTYVNQFDGPAVSSLNSPYAPDKKTGLTDEHSPIMFENILGVGFKVTPTIKIQPNFYWTYEPGGKGLNLTGDSYVSFSHSNLVTAGNYKLTGEARFYVPITEASQAARRRVSGRFILNHNYDVPNTKFSLGAYTFWQEYVYNNVEAGYSWDTNEDGTRFKKPFNAAKAPWKHRVYAGPNVTYAVTDKIQVSALVELNSRVRSGKSMFSDWENPDAANFEPGVNFDITKNVSINPWLDIPFTGRVALDTTTVGGVIVWKLL